MAIKVHWGSILSPTTNRIYIQSIVKNAEKMVGSMYRFRKYLTSSNKVYQIRLDQRWSIVAISTVATRYSFSGLEIIQGELRFPTCINFPTYATLQPKATSLGNSDELYSLVRPDQNVTTTTRYVTFIESNHRNSFRIQIISVLRTQLFSPKCLLGGIGAREDASPDH